MVLDRSAYDHPAWLTAVGMGVGYGLIVLLMTVVLFVVPWLLFAFL